QTHTHAGRRPPDYTTALQRSRLVTQSPDSQQALAASTETHTQHTHSQEGGEENEEEEEEEEGRNAHFPVVYLCVCVLCLCVCVCVWGGYFCCCYCLLAVQGEGNCFVSRRFQGLRFSVCFPPLPHPLSLSLYPSLSLSLFFSYASVCQRY